MSSTKDEKGDQSENGFYCEVCDCIVKDSLNYLDHVNGKRHNRNLGISLKKFTDSTLEEVKEMLEFKKREREDRINGYSVEDQSKDDEDTWRRMKREKKKRQKARRSGALVDRDEDDDDDDSDQEKDKEDEEDGPNDDEDAMAELMGFSSFGTSKK